jgi:MFS family permease
MNAAERRSASPLEGQIQRSLTACWKEGVASQIMLGILDSYLTPYALLLGAAGQQIGYLTAFPNLLGSISQFFAVRAVHAAGNRRRLLVGVIASQFLFLVPIGFLAFFPFGHRILMLMLLVAGFRTLGSLMGPAWGSLVSEYLPAERRGDYFGWRSRVVAISGLCGMAFWGVFLNAWKNVGTPAVGFLILFLSCTALRFISLYYMSRMVDLPMHRTEESEFTFWEFLRRFRESNFVKFVFFVAGAIFSIQVAAPYLSVYLLKELKFSYLGYMLVTLASVFASLVSYPLWGRHADVVGTARILKLTGLLLPLTPLLWILARNVPALVAVELFSGFVWGGFNLCATNFIFDAASPAKRVRCLGYFNLITGTAAFGGAALGGFLSERMPLVMGSSLAGLFLVSAGLRLAANLMMARHFREVREKTEPITSLRLFFSVVGLRPFMVENAELTPVAPPAAAVHYGDRSSPTRRQSPRE